MQANDIKLTHNIIIDNHSNSHVVLGFAEYTENEEKIFVVHKGMHGDFGMYITPYKSISDGIFPNYINKESDAIPERDLSSYKGKMVRHFKGDLYLVFDFARSTENGKMFVIYKALYEDCKTYAREYNMFGEEVPEGRENPTGQTYRFEHVALPSVKA